jgi:alkylhydroperoxidase family enzyme
MCPPPFATGIDSSRLSNSSAIRNHGEHVLTEDKKRAAYRALEDRILNGAGTATPEQRARAFSNAALSQPLARLVGKVPTRPAQVTEADFAAARAAGFSEDQLFELVICAAVGQSARLYDAGLAALAGAIGDRRTGNAP